MVNLHISHCDDIYVKVFRKHFRVNDVCKLGIFDFVYI